MQELREIPGFPNYFCDKLGNIYSLYKQYGRFAEKTDGILKKVSPGRKPDGYLNKSLHAVDVNGNKIKKVKMVHRIILETWTPETFDPSLECNHINGIKDDNRLENLEMVTKSQNQQHRRKILGKRGSTTRKLDPEKVRRIKYLKKRGLSNSVVAKMFGVTSGSVIQIVQGKTWKHVK